MENHGSVSRLENTTYGAEVHFTLLFTNFICFLCSIQLISFKFMSSQNISQPCWHKSFSEPCDWLLKQFNKKVNHLFPLQQPEIGCFSIYFSFFFSSKSIFPIIYFPLIFLYLSSYLLMTIYSLALMISHNHSAATYWTLIHHSRELNLSQA